MNLKTLLTLLASVTLTIQTANSMTLAERFEFQPESDKFYPKETLIDIYGTWRSLEEEAIGFGRPGLGIGGAHFFHRNWGVGGDLYFQELDLPDVNASLIGRYPIEYAGTAPYVFGGMGYQLRDPMQWTAHIGGGLEYRLNRWTGVFVDVRRTFRSENQDGFQFRGGFRLGLERR